MNSQTATSLICFMNKKKIMETQNITIINNKTTFYDTKGNIIQINQNQDQLEINIELDQKN